MRAEYINPFLNAAVSVVETMAQLKPEPGKPVLKQGNLSFGDITGIIGLAGMNVSGNMCVSFQSSCIVKIVNNMLGTDHTSINDEIADAVGELTNMICGGTKKELNQMGLSIQMATPVVLRGANIEISQLSATPVISIPFTTSAGQFVVEATLSAQTQAEKALGGSAATLIK